MAARPQDRPDVAGRQHRGNSGHRVGGVAALMAAVRTAGPRDCMADIAGRLGVSRSSVCTMVSRWERRGVLAREAIGTGRQGGGQRIIIIGEEPPDQFGNWSRTHWHDKALDAIRALGRAPTLRQIGERIGCTAAWVHRLLDDLEAVGEIERPGAPGTRRPIIICDD